MSNNPFGHSISSDDIKDTLGFVDSWEERYKYIIDLGKDLPDLPAEKRTEDRLVRGCQSQVWIQEYIFETFNMTDFTEIVSKYKSIVLLYSMSHGCAFE